MTKVSDGRSFLWIPLLSIAGTIALGGCSDSGRSTGRDWANTAEIVDVRLQPDGLLSMDARLPAVLQNNCKAYIETIAYVLKQRQLFNRSPVPLRIYYMFEAADFRRFGGQQLDPLGAFVPEENALYLHADGRPLVDRGQLRRFVREYSRAVIDDMYAGTYPKWFAVGLSRYLAEGAFVRDEWHAGLPDPVVWQPLLAEREIEFEVLIKDGDAGFATLGPKGEALAEALMYLLRQLDEDKFTAIVYQFQARGLESDVELRALIEELVPNARKRLARPVDTLFKLRPDLLIYLECGVATASAKVLERAKANAGQHLDIAGYQAQCGFLQLAVDGDEKLAAAAFERARKGPAHRHLPRTLEALARIYMKSGNLAGLREVAVQMLQTSVLPTPRMHRMLAEATLGTEPEVARRHIAAGLELPGAGFEAAVIRLRELQKDLAK